MGISAYTDAGNTKLYHRYLKEIKKYPLLKKSRERELLQQARDGSQGAFELLVCSNLKFVIKVAFMYRGQGLPVNDLISEGNIGLMEAARRFDLTQKVKFTSYAVWWIRQAIIRALFEKARLVRISAEKELKIRKLSREHRLWPSREGRPSSLPEMTLDGKAALFQMARWHTSLDTPAGEQMRDTLVSRLEYNPEQWETGSSTDSKVKVFLNTALSTLSPKERKVLSLTFGLDSHSPMTLQDIGDLLGLSKERIRQLRESGLVKLRDMYIPREYLEAA